MSMLSMDFRVVFRALIKELAILTMYVVFIYGTLLFSVALFNIARVSLTEEQYKTVQLFVYVGFGLLYVGYQIKRFVAWVRSGRIV